MKKKGDEIKAARYNKVTSKIEVLVGKKSSFETRTYYILSLSESGKVDSCLHLPVKQLPHETLNDILTETLEKTLKEATRESRPAARQTQAVDQKETTLEPLRTWSQSQSLATTLAVPLAELLGETQRWGKTMAESMVTSLAQLLQYKMGITYSTGMIEALVQSELEKIMRETLEETPTVTGTLTVRPATLGEILAKEIRPPLVRHMFDDSYNDSCHDPLAKTLAAVLQGRCQVGTREGRFLFSLTPYPSCRFLQHPTGPIALMIKNDKSKTYILFVRTVHLE